MTTSPNIDELKEATGSNDIATCFKFLFKSEAVESRGLLARLEEECRQLGDKVQKRERTSKELHLLGPFHEKGFDALGCVVNEQIAEHDILQGLERTVGLIRDAIAQQEANVTLMEVNEELSDG